MDRNGLAAETTAGRFLEAASFLLSVGPTMATARSAPLPPESLDLLVVRYVLAALDCKFRTRRLLPQQLHLKL